MHFLRVPLALVLLVTCVQTASAGFAYQFVNHPELSPYTLSGTITFEIPGNPVLPVEFLPSYISDFFLQVRDTNKPVGEQVVFTLDSKQEEIIVPDDPPMISQATFFITAVSPGTTSMIAFQGVTTLNIITFTITNPIGMSPFGTVSFSPPINVTPFNIPLNTPSLTIARAVPEPSSLVMALTLFGGVGLVALRRRSKQQAA